MRCRSAVLKGRDKAAISSTHRKLRRVALLARQQCDAGTRRPMPDMPDRGGKWHGHEEPWCATGFASGYPRPDSSATFALAPGATGYASAPPCLTSVRGIALAKPVAHEDCSISPCHPPALDAIEPYHTKG